MGGGGGETINCIQRKRLPRKVFFYLILTFFIIIFCGEGGMHYAHCTAPNNPCHTLVCYANSDFIRNCLNSISIRKDLLYFLHFFNFTYENWRGGGTSRAWNIFPRVLRTINSRIALFHIKLFLCKLNLIKLSVLHKGNQTFKYYIMSAKIKI